MIEMEKELCISITEINHNLIVTVSDELTDDNMRVVSDLIMRSAYERNIKGAVMNFSMVTVLDTFSFTAFKNITKALFLMGIRVVWSGLRASVVSALMDLNIEISTEEIVTTLTLEQGLLLLGESGK